MVAVFSKKKIRYWNPKCFRWIRKSAFENRFGCTRGAVENVNAQACYKKNLETSSKVACCRSSGIFLMRLENVRAVIKDHNFPISAVRPLYFLIDSKYISQRGSRAAAIDTNRGNRCLIRHLAIFMPQFSWKKFLVFALSHDRSIFFWRRLSMLPVLALFSGRVVTKVPKNKFPPSPLLLF